MRATTVEERRRLYLLAQVAIARHYRRDLTLELLARGLASSPRQLQRVFAQIGQTSFHEALIARRTAVAADLLLEQSIPVVSVARLVGYRHAPSFSRAFKARYGLTPARFREEGRRARAGSQPGMAPFSRCIRSSAASASAVRRQTSRGRLASAALTAAGSGPESHGQ